MKEAVNLAIFDIDGTLTRTNQVDDRCFVQAFADELGLMELHTDWSCYPTIYDLGLVRHIFLERVRRLPTVDEIARLQQRFVMLLEKAYDQTPQLFVEVPGAGEALKKLRQEPDWYVTIATDGWQLSALFKLQKAQLDITKIPAAFAVTMASRGEILSLLPLPGLRPATSRTVSVTLSTSVMESGISALLDSSTWRFLGLRTANARRPCAGKAQPPLSKASRTLIDSDKR